MYNMYNIKGKITENNRHGHMYAMALRPVMACTCIAGSQAPARLVTTCCCCCKLHSQELAKSYIQEESTVCSTAADAVSGVIVQ